MRERAQEQDALEERLHDSKKNLARSDELLARLKKIFSRSD
jgi:hypothetical protein